MALGSLPQTKIARITLLRDLRQPDNAC